MARRRGRRLFAAATSTTRRNQLTRRVQVLLSGRAGPYLALIETGSGCDQTAAGPECKKAAKEPRYLGIRTVPLLGGGAYRRGIDVCWLWNDAGLQLHRCCLTNNSLRAAGAAGGAAGATESLPARIFAFSASNSACDSTPESSSSLNSLSFAALSDICDRDKKSEVTKQPVVLEDDGGSLLESSSRILGFIFGF